MVLVLVLVVVVGGAGAGASFRHGGRGATSDGADDPAFAALKAEYAGVLGGAPPGLPPDRGRMELAIETGDAPMPRSRPVKRPLSDSEGGLAGLHAQLIDLLDRGRIQHSTASHAATAVLARKPDGTVTWRICYDYRDRGLNAISRPAVEPGPLPHMDALLDGARGSVRAERGALRAPGFVIAPDVRHDRGAGGRRVGPLLSCQRRRHVGGVGPAGPVRARVYGRLSGALADAGAAPAGRRGGARDLSPAKAAR